MNNSGWNDLVSTISLIICIIVGYIYFDNAKAVFTDYSFDRTEYNFACYSPDGKTFIRAYKPAKSILDLLDRKSKKSPKPSYFNYYSYSENIDIVTINVTVSHDDNIINGVTFTSPDYPFQFFVVDDNQPKGIFYVDRFKQLSFMPREWITLQCFKTRLVPTPAR